MGINRWSDIEERKRKFILRSSSTVLLLVK
jgi:hypothetical protein